MRKKVFLAVIAVAVFSGIVFGIIGCTTDKGSAEDSIGNPFAENFVEMDYSAGYTKVDGLDAMEVLISAYNTWKSNTSYKRTEAFDFNLDASGIEAKQQSLTVYKRDGEQFYKENVKITTGAQKDNIGERVYYDGNKVYSIYFNDKDRVPAETGNIFAVTNWGSYAEWTPGDRYENFDALKFDFVEELNPYDWDDKANMAADCDYSVYEKDGKYYFTLTIDCSKEKMDTVHTAARDSVIAGTGGIPGTLEMMQNTKVDYIVTPMSDGTYRFDAWRRTEYYKGKKKALFEITITAECRQSTVTVFDYETTDYKITAEDKLNLA